MLDHNPTHLPDDSKTESITVSLIVAVYKRVDFLELVLLSVEQQSFRDLEVIIAEDDQSEEVKSFIEKMKGSFSFPLKHVSHEDRGFRKNKILNDALRKSEGRYVVFIDGDCVLHRKFIEEHVKYLGPDVCLFGRRAMLDQNTTDRLIRTKDIGGISFFNLLLTKTRRLEDALYLPWLPNNRKTGVQGSNFSLSRELILRINGFDEDFERPYGGEDTDIERRLRLLNIRIKCTKFKTIQYHLEHGGREGRDEEWETAGRLFYQSKIEEGRWYCRNGLNKTE